MATTANLWHAQFIDTNGNPYSGVQVYHYEAGTTTNKDVYRDKAKSTVETQPVKGDSLGIVKFYGDGTYRLKVVSADNVQITDLDPIDITSSYSGTPSRILFYGTAGTVTDDSTFTWDTTNQRLAVGTATNVTERIVMPSNSYLAAERDGAGTGEGAKRLIGINSSNKVSIDPQGLGIALENLDATGLLYLDANGEIKALKLQNGFLPIGSTGSVPVAALPLGSTGLSIVGGEGTLTLENSGAVVIDRNTTLHNIVSTSSETELYLVTVPPLSPNRAVRLTILGYYLNDDGANRTFDLTVKIDGQAVYDDTTTTLANNSAIRSLNMTFYLAALGSSAAWVTGQISVAALDAAATGVGTLATVDTINSTIQGIAVLLDTTASVRFGIYITHSAASANLSLARQYANAVIL